MSKNYQDELASLSSKVNEFAFKSPPTMKSIEETGLIDKPPTFINNNNMIEYVKKYGTYVITPIVIFIILYFFKPSFLTITMTNDEGEDINVLSIKKLFLCTIGITIPLIAVIYMYLLKKN